MVALITGMIDYLIMNITLMIQSLILISLLILVSITGLKMDRRQ